MQRFLENQNRSLSVSRGSFFVSLNAMSTSKLRLEDIEVIHGCKIGHDMELYFILEIKRGQRVEIAQHKISENALSSPSFAQFYSQYPFESKSVKELKQRLINDVIIKNKRNRLDKIPVIEISDEDDDEKSTNTSNVRRSLRIQMKSSSKLTSECHSASSKQSDKAYEFKIFSFCSNEHCKVMKVPTINDELKLLKCALCVHKWQRAEHKWQCIECQSIYCSECQMKDQMESSHAQLENVNNAPKAPKYQSCLTLITPTKPPDFMQMERRNKECHNKEKNLSFALTRIEPIKPPIAQTNDESNEQTEVRCKSIGRKRASLGLSELPSMPRKKRIKMCDDDDTTSNVFDWSPISVFVWFESLKKNMFGIHREKIKNKMLNSNICGKNLSSLSDITLTLLGIVDFETRQLILSNVRRLLLLGQ